MEEQELPKEVQEKIAQLQLYQQRMQMIVAQKQQFQLQLMEIDNALGELKNAKKATYKLVGEVLIEKDKKEIEKELKESKDKFELRIKSMDKQEKATRDQALELQKKLQEELK